MKLSILQDFLRVGGTEHQALSLTEHFRRLGHDAELITFRPGGTLQSRVKARKLAVRALQPLDTGINGWAPGWKRALRESRPDAVILMGRCANALGYKIQRAFPEMRVVATLRTGRPLPTAYRRTLGTADRVVANSRWARERALEAGAPPERLAVVPNALIRRPRPGQPAEWRSLKRAALGMDADVFVMAYTAAFLPGKNHVGLLEALGGLEPGAAADWRLLLLGRGPLRKAMVKVTRHLGISDRVLFAGYQNPPGPWLAAADLYVSPSLEESLPNAVMEAQAIGLPVAAFDTAGVKEALAPGKSGELVPAGDIPALREQVAQLAGDPSRRAAMARGALAVAEGYPTPEAQAKAYLDCIQAR